MLTGPCTDHSRAQRPATRLRAACRADREVTGPPLERPAPTGGSYGHCHSQPRRHARRPRSRTHSPTHRLRPSAPDAFPGRAYECLGARRSFAGGVSSEPRRTWRVCHYTSGHSTWTRPSRKSRQAGSKPGGGGDLQASPERVLRQSVRTAIQRSSSAHAAAGSAFRVPGLNLPALIDAVDANLGDSAHDRARELGAPRPSWPGWPRRVPEPGIRTGAWV